jgi:hypothetical protein
VNKKIRGAIKKEQQKRHLKIIINHKINRKDIVKEKRNFKGYKKEIKSHRRNRVLNITRFTKLSVVWSRLIDSLDFLRNIIVTIEVIMIENGITQFSASIIYSIRTDKSSLGKQNYKFEFRAIKKTVRV